MNPPTGNKQGTRRPRRPARGLLIASAMSLGLLGLAGCGSDSGGGDGGATSAEITKSQNELAALGCYDFPADGEYGPHTEDAIRSFQEASDLDVDGELDSETRSAISAAAEAGTTVC